ncbi:MAG TPA: glycosyltransferase, partial [Micromonosporaceae bacterium]
MRIAQVAPPWLPLPPRGHGGTELVVTVLTEQLHRMGHEVSLFAPGGSRSRARLVPVPDEPAGLDAMPDLAFERGQINAVNRRIADFDVVHVHTARQATMAATLDVPVVLTLHDPPSPALAEVPRRVWRVPPSRHYLERAGPLALADPVHHGIDVAAYPLRMDKEDFLLFMGRAVPEKGLHLAIAAARQAGLPLVAVAVRSGFAREARYLAEVVAPLLGDDVTVLDQVDFAGKVDLMGRAKGFLFPIDWDEPFGLVVVEAMACGTPV